MGPNTYMRQIRQTKAFSPCRQYFELNAFGIQTTSISRVNLCLRKTNLETSSRCFIMGLPLDLLYANFEMFDDWPICDVM